jgi:polar amino acid transport system substrate-binding protein
MTRLAHAGLLHPCLALLCLALLGCPSGDGAAGNAGGETPAAEGTVAKIKARGELIVACDAGYIPFEVIEQDGTITGFDVDLVQAVADRLGVKPKIRNVAWNGIVGELRTGKCDVIFSGMSVTPERQKAVLFSEPYFDIGQVVVKRAGDDRIKGWEDLNAEGMTIAVQESTTGEQAVRRMIPKAKLLRFPKTDAACLAVIQEKADAVVFDHPYLMKYVEEKAEGKLEGIWKPFTREQIAAAVRQDSADLKAEIDAALAELTQSGKMAELKASYFGEAAEVDLSGAADASAGADEGADAGADATGG